MERIAGFEVHPAASAFPRLGGAELEQLAKDITERGQELPVVLHEGRVLDGRNRLLACERAKVEPKTVEWDGRGGSPTAFVVAANLRRRHLTDSQRAMVAAELLPLFEAEAKERQRAAGGDRRTVAAQGREANGEGTAAAAAAKTVGSAERSVQRAKAVAKKAPKLAEQVKAGRVTLKQAEKQLRTNEQLKKVKAYHPPEGRYPVIVADPPWPYEDELDGSDAARGGLPYPPMKLEDICGFKVPADKDCVLFLWVTNAHLVDGSAKRVLDAWGFQPKTLVTWVKDRMGVGRWLRNITEHCILAVKGRPTVTLTNQTTELRAPRGAHSAKPAELFSLVESLCPAGPRLELWARGERKGWVTSGAEASESKPELPKCEECGGPTLSKLCYQCAQAESRARRKAAWIAACYVCRSSKEIARSAWTHDLIGRAHNACLNKLSEKDQRARYRKLEELAKKEAPRLPECKAGCGLRVPAKGSGYCARCQEQRKRNKKRPRRSA